MFKIVKLPGRDFEVSIYQEISLTDLQSIVEGYIEVVHLRFYERKLHHKDYILIVNEEGRIRHMPINLTINDGRTPIHGPVIILRQDNNGVLKGLTKEEVKEIISLLKR